MALRIIVNFAVFVAAFNPGHYSNLLLFKEANSKPRLDGNSEAGSLLRPWFNIRDSSVLLYVRRLVTALMGNALTQSKYVWKFLNNFRLPLKLRCRPPLFSSFSVIFCCWIKFHPFCRQYLPSFHRLVEFVSTRNKLRNGNWGFRWVLSLSGEIYKSSQSACLRSLVPTWRTTWSGESSRLGLIVVFHSFCSSLRKQPSFFAPGPSGVSREGRLRFTAENSILMT